MGLLPFGDGVLKELLKRQRPNELERGRQDDVGLIPELVELVHDEFPVQLTQGTDFRC